MAFQKYQNSRQLLTELNSNKPENMYLFLGEEEGEKEKIIAKIINMILKDQDEKGYSSGRFHLESDEFSNAAEFVTSQSMFSEKKVCVMLNVNALKAKGTDKELLNEILSTIPDSNILIMTSPENKVPSVFGSSIIAKIKVYQFWKYFDSDIVTYVLNKIKKNNLTAGRTAISKLIELTGRDIRKIDEAIETIVDTGEKSVTTELIERYISDTKDVSVFEFIDALFQKDKSSFSHLAKVLDNGTHELAVLKLIMRQAELIEKYLYSAGESFTSDEILKKIGISPKNAKNFISSTQKFSRGSIKNVFPLIFIADQRIKTSSYSDNLVSNPVFELVTNILLTSAN